MIVPVPAAIDVVAATTAPASAAAASVAAGSLVGLLLGLTGGGSNPNRELVEELIASGVEVRVCGQSVIRGGNPLADVLPGVRIAQSAMTLDINRPSDGRTAIGVY